MLEGHVLEEVELVADHRTVDRKVVYLVQWASDKEKTWEAAEHLGECDEALAVYWRSFIQKDPHHSYILPNPAEQQKQPRETKANGKAAQKTKETGAKRQKKAVSRPVSDDKIAVAKRVQMNKMLAGSRSRGIRVAAAAASSSAALAAEGRTATKPPPAFAKRSSFDVVMEDTGIESPRSVPSCSASASPQIAMPAQRARKSTGRRVPGFDPAELPRADAEIS
ncbi:hypothetical protein LPJ75_005726 [Coemansia sp. RSA 2598]|nr:hypothetical protein LPJ75_005726 [Coemansia sp. RSA 2598]